MHVIVIVLDSLRADHVGCYGSAVETPHIDRLAADGIVCEQAYSENLPTMPTRAAWWLGRHLFTRRGWQPFERDDLLLAELLYANGWASALVTDTYHMHKPGYNCGRGFDTTVFVRGQEYDPWIVDSAVEVDLDLHHRFRGPGWKGLWTDDYCRFRFGQYLRNRSRFVAPDDWPAARTFAAATRWLDHAVTLPDERLFLWVDSFSPHEPWDPPEPWRSRYDPDYEGQEIIDPVPGPVAGYMTDREVAHTKALYGGLVTFTDVQVGRLLDKLVDLGLYDDSLVVLMADHGEPFGEHGVIRKASLVGYEELARIPWIVKLPGGGNAGHRVRSFVQPPDLFPTILSLTGVELDSARRRTGDARDPATLPAITGKDLLPALRGKGETGWDFAVTAHHGRSWTIRDAAWTCVHHLDDRADELYDRAVDPAEQHDLAAQQPEVVAELVGRLEAFAAGMDAA